MLVAETVDLVEEVAAAEDLWARRKVRKAKMRDVIMIVIFWEGIEQETK